MYNKKDFKECNKKDFKEMSNNDLIQNFARLYSLPTDSNGKTRKGDIKKAGWIIEEFVKRGIIEESDVENIASFFDGTLL